MRDRWLPHWWTSPQYSKLLPQSQRRTWTIHRHQTRDPPYYLRPQTISMECGQCAGVWPPCPRRQEQRQGRHQHHPLHPMIRHVRRLKGHLRPLRCQDPIVERRDAPITPHIRRQPHQLTGPSQKPKCRDDHDQAPPKQLCLHTRCKIHDQWDQIFLHENTDVAVQIHAHLHHHD